MRYYNALTLRDNLHQTTGDADMSLVGRALGDKMRRTLDRAYRLAGLLHGADDIAAARYAIEEGDPLRRNAAIEYLDNVLSGAVRRHLLPIVDERSLADKVRHANTLLKSRPRDLPDTLAQLVHDDDPVIAAAAIHFSTRYSFPALADDLAYVLAHRPASDRIVVEAAAWALSGDGRDENFPLPAVRLDRKS